MANTKLVNVCSKISGGNGGSCDGKYKACQCMSGYTWNAASGTCTANSSGPCDGKSNGANGNYYCCDNDVVGVKTSSMNFYISKNDLGYMNWNTANTQCSKHVFCGNVKGTLPTLNQLSTIYNNKSQINNLLSTNYGSELTESWYWSSSYDRDDSHLFVNMFDGFQGWNLDTESCYVRPILSTSSSGGGSTCDSSYKYTCTYSSSTHISGGFGTACGGKYKKCTCQSGYVWKKGSCQKQVLNGAQGELYYCDDKVVGIKTTGMNFYVALRDLGRMSWYDANSSCQSYSFCDGIKGTLPTRDQLFSIYNNRTELDTLFLKNGGTKIIRDRYWSSTNVSSDLYDFVDMLNGDCNRYDNNNFNEYVRPILTP